MPAFESGLDGIGAALAEIVFDTLQPVEVSVKLGGEQYWLKEASEAAAVAYRNATAAAVKMVEGEVSGLGAVGDVEPLLVSYCLWKDTPQGRQPVPVSVVRGWPAKVVKALFARVKEISELDEPDTLEQVDKQIARLQKKRERMTRDGAPGKDEPSPSTPTSTTVPPSAVN